MTAAAHWIREHDDRLSFVVFYISGAIILSIVLNLFWVMMLMLGHFILEIFRGYLIRAERPFTHALSCPRPRSRRAFWYRGTGITYLRSYH
jgi:hypothetical protein